jgi:hypothetical protein
VNNGPTNFPDPSGLQIPLPGIGGEGGDDRVSRSDVSLSGRELKTPLVNKAHALDGQLVVDAKSNYGMFISYAGKNARKVKFFQTVQLEFEVTDLKGKTAFHNVGGKIEVGNKAVGLRPGSQGVLVIGKAGNRPLNLDHPSLERTGWKYYSDSPFAGYSDNSEAWMVDQPDFPRGYLRMNNGYLNDIGARSASLHAYFDTWAEVNGVIVARVRWEAYAGWSRGLINGISRTYISFAGKSAVWINDEVYNGRNNVKLSPTPEEAKKVLNAALLQGVLP